MPPINSDTPVSKKGGRCASNTPNEATDTHRAIAPRA
jgi:hypothetical protein